MTIIPSKWKTIIEGLLFMAGDDGMTAKQLAEVLGEDIQTSEAEDAVRELQEEYAEGNRGMRIALLAGSYRMTTNPEHAPFFERMAYMPSKSVLSQAAIEVLSIIAYRQPITRVEIEQIRGVKSDRSLQTLAHKDLIHEVGRAEAIGRPILYGTTQTFLDYFNLPNLKALPALPEVSDDDLDEQTYLLFDQMEGRANTMKDE